ncbi:esterase-like activity of phytase family protein [Cyanobacterium stanieri LEGE 03274]|uniref:Esterase-like activity of phytase family protein n=1 Tax=Cyanobacterium stanieri LEGE 03274 TaxID=1828756 RepID=A0ABR9V3H8_9CHRO|nr:esterase-like activity of phytase family protein [Cyanobacterium stanieri]MBE9222450.1 esterase-like activity of phytase family protein [Cyanobacterium stanieri LEGE 03274]
MLNKISKIITLLIIICSLFFIDINPVFAQERLFLDLSLEYLDTYELKIQDYENTKVGGFSGITYNQQKDYFYVISDDRSRLAPARFYTVKINIENDKIDDVILENVTFLKDNNGELYANDTIDPEAIALSPRNSIFISSEGISHLRVAPFINEYDLDGNLLSEVPIPKRYIYNKEEKKGIQDNYGFESLTIKANATMAQDPFRLFTGSELALTQDFNDKIPETLLRSRMMHYVVNPFGQPVLISENLYPVNQADFGVIYNGLNELYALPEEGYLLSLERTFGLRGFGAKIFQIVMANATDIYAEKSLAGNIDNINLIKKKLLLNLKDLNIDFDNLEGLTFGPRLPDGSQSLILVSDNNFKYSTEKTQFLLFKIVKNTQGNN